MGPAEWIAAVVAVIGFAGWMLALWFRAGQILERIERISGDHEKHGDRLDDHERRLTKTEIILASMK
jgi:hypothetical protein